MTEFLVSSVFLSGLGGLAAGIVFGGYIRRGLGSLMTSLGSKIGG
jgi:hypothetical protein